VTEPDEVVPRIQAADAGHAAAIVLGLPWPQTRAVLVALGPREVARLLVGARADRVPDLVEHTSPGLLPRVLTHLDAVRVAQLISLLPMELAVRVVQSLSPSAAAELLLTLPTHQRLALQAALPSTPAPPGPGEYARAAEQALRRSAERLTWLDPGSGSLIAELFGRTVQVVVWDAPDTQFTAAHLHAVAAAVDWRRVNALLVMTNAGLDSGVGAAVRDARQHGFVIDTLIWHDERDDGQLKRALVRFAG
jgi:hypothetical protein